MSFSSCAVIGSIGQKSPVCLLLLPPEQIELLSCFLLDGVLLGASGLENGVKELDFVFVEGAELILQPDGFLKCFLFGS